MTQSISVHTLQIARELKIHDDRIIASFFQGDTAILLCTAWYGYPNVRRIESASGWMGVETASAQSIAIQMAIEWLAEQK
jgi:hypothetical protein